MFYRARLDPHLSHAVSGGGQPGLRVCAGARPVREGAGPGAAGARHVAALLAPALLQQVVPGAHPLEKSPGGGEPLVVGLCSVHGHLGSLQVRVVVQTDGVAGVGRRKARSGLSRNV